METVFQVLTQGDVVAELARRVNPASGPDHAPFREQLRKAELVVMDKKTFDVVDRRWAQCLQSATRGDNYKDARAKLHKVYGTIGQVLNGGVDRRAFEINVANNYSYNRGVQDSHLRPRSETHGHNRDARNRVFYEGNEAAIVAGAKEARDNYNRTASQIQEVPSLFLLVIDWAEGGEEEEEEVEEEEEADN